MATHIKIEEPKSKGYSNAIIFLVVILLILIFIVPRGFNNIALFDFNIKAEDYSGLFTHLLIVAVIVERFIEVYTAIWRKEDRVKLDSKLREANITVPKDDADIVSIQAEIEEYRAVTGIYTMYGAFAIGLVIALAGVNTLGVLFDVSNLSSNQLHLFKAVDILITSGIIAGGSKGINGMTSLLAELISTTEKKVKANSPDAIK